MFLGLSGIPAFLVSSAIESASNRGSSRERVNRLENVKTFLQYFLILERPLQNYKKKLKTWLLVTLVVSDHGQMTIEFVNKSLKKS